MAIIVAATDSRPVITVSGGGRMTLYSKLTAKLDNWHTVKAVEKTYLSEKYRKIPLKHIGIDEVHMGTRIVEV